MKIVIAINQELMGIGDPELGKTLMGAFLKKLWARSEKPDMLILYNGGVKLLGNDSSVLDALYGLEQSGVEIIACGTCLDYYSIDSNLKVGRRSDMVEIVNMMMEAEKLISI
jgi:selenium metabolism protein YedF